MQLIRQIQQISKPKEEKHDSVCNRRHCLDINFQFRTKSNFGKKIVAIIRMDLS